ncbi:hypothetical protein WG66_008077 [Moniliophthora roreri]|nr:hypothetical protein WG66_008077 [Moniliophthora roreri]
MLLSRRTKISRLYSTNERLTFSWSCDSLDKGIDASRWAELREHVTSFLPFDSAARLIWEPQRLY